MFIILSPVRHIAVATINPVPFIVARTIKNRSVTLRNAPAI